MTLHDVLRALVRGEVRGEDAVADAVAAIDAHEKAGKPASGKKEASK